MHTRVVRPAILAPHELDSYLSQGWYRIGQTMMTCRFLVFEGELRSTVWTRTRLTDFTFRKSQRKLINQLRRRFRVTTGPATLDAAHEGLYQRYREQARGERSPTLQYFLYEGSEHSLFETSEIALWDGDTLVAFSWYDHGRATVQSLTGVYDPDYASYSLGYGTMLLEVAHAINLGMEFHYAGYVLPGEPAMDYKLRVGHMEFLDHHGAWRPWEDFTEQTTPTARVARALDTVAEALTSRGIRAERRTYAMFEAPAYDRAMHRCLDEPMIVECFAAPMSPTALIVTWSVEQEVYRIIRCARAVGLVRSHHDVDAAPREVELLVSTERLGMRRASEALADDLLRLLQAAP